MTSPFEQEAQRQQHEALLPADNWRMRRTQTMASHEPSIATLADAVYDMGALLLNREIATDLQRTVEIDLENVRPSEEVGRLAVGIIPTGPHKRWHEYGLWSPDVAMNISILLRDEYTRPAQSKPQPVGNVGLELNIRTWGQLSAEARAVIDDLPDAWTRVGDNSYNRTGTMVQVRRKAGEQLTRLQAETILAPLSRHVVDYFELTDQPNLKQYQTAGTFTSGRTTQAQARSRSQSAADLRRRAVSRVFALPLE